MAPVSTRGLQATFLKTIAPNPLLRSRAPAQKTFGAATGVSDPRLQKTRIRNNHAGGKAATVAGDAGPGFHNWPPGHILQNTDPNPLLRSRAPTKKDVRRRDRGQRPTATEDPNTKQRHRRLSRRCSRVRRPRFPHVALRPHPSKHGSESALTQPVTCSKDVRRRDRGQRPAATEDPNTKQRHRRQRRHCSWGRWPRFPQLAPGPHPSRHGSESASTQPVTCSKDVRRRDRGQRPTATEEADTFFFNNRHSPRPFYYHPLLGKHPIQQTAFRIVCVVP